MDTTSPSNDQTVSFGEDFLQFLNESTTAFHAVEACKIRLKAAGFIYLSEKEIWELKKGEKYFFVRNDTSIMAFYVGSNYNPDQSSGFTVLGAHTDSPCLKIKPVVSFKKSDALVLNTQPYGGGLWHTWFDRDLGMAGRAIIRNGDSIQSRLFKVDKPIARIPNLAIHLTSDGERTSFSPNLQEHAKAILTMNSDWINTQPLPTEVHVSSRIHPGILRIASEELQVDVSMIEDLEMQLIDVQPSSFGGIGNEFIFSGRLDNLCSSYQCLRALIDTVIESQTNPIEQSNIKMIMLFDHEEIGSSSFNGAGSSMFMDSIRLIHDSFSDRSNASFLRTLRNSFVVSVDMAHGLHPNYTHKHDMTMAPKLNGGLVIKHNANQRYATNAVSATIFRRIGKLVNVPVQEFTVRSDSACGSTIGPIISTLSGILTVDCGTPQFSMHSIREMMAKKDAYIGYLHLKGVFEHHPKLTSKLDAMP